MTVLKGFASLPADTFAPGLASGANFDIESFNLAKDGSIWICEEFGAI